MKLREVTHVHVEKLFGSPFLPVAYLVDSADPLQRNNAPTDTLGANSVLIRCKPILVVQWK